MMLKQLVEALSMLSLFIIYSILGILGLSIFLIACICIMGVMLVGLPLVLVTDGYMSLQNYLIRRMYGKH